MSIMNVLNFKCGTSGLSILLANFVPISRYIRKIRMLLQLPSRTRSIDKEGSLISNIYVTIKALCEAMHIVSIM